MSDRYDSDLNYKELTDKEELEAEKKAGRLIEDDLDELEPSQTGPNEKNENEGELPISDTGKTDEQSELNELNSEEVSEQFNPNE